jgi:hypothetical protein
MILDDIVKEKCIGYMYPEAKVRSIAAELADKDLIETLCNRWGLKKEISLDLVKLTLFDVVLLLDDSASMRFGGGRIVELKIMLSYLAFATGLFDRGGFSVRFMNSDVPGDNIKTEEEAAALVDQVRFGGVTSLAASLKGKVLDPYIYEPYEAGILKKPLLVKIITDGEVFPDISSNVRPQLTTDSPPVMLVPSSRNTSVQSRTISEGREVRSPIFPFKSSLTYYSTVVSFQFTQVGVDRGAQEFLAELGTDDSVGRLTNCMSSTGM